MRVKWQTGSMFWNWVLWTQWVHVIWTRIINQNPKPKLVLLLPCCSVMFFTLSESCFVTELQIWCQEDQLGFRVLIWRWVTNLLPCHKSSLTQVLPPPAPPCPPHPLWAQPPASLASSYWTRTKLKFKIVSQKFLRVPCTGSPSPCPGPFPYWPFRWN